VHTLSANEWPSPPTTNRPLRFAIVNSRRRQPIRPFSRANPSQQSRGIADNACQVLTDKLGAGVESGEPRWSHEFALEWGLSWEMGTCGVHRTIAGNIPNPDRWITVWVNIRPSPQSRPLQENAMVWAVFTEVHPESRHAAIRNDGDAM
jgi:hypothetical protein